MKKQLSNIWDPIRSWFGCVYLQIIKIVLYGIFIALAVWALTAITSLKTTEMRFRTEGFCTDSITITYDIHVMQIPSKEFSRYDITTSYDYPCKYRDYLSQENPIPIYLPSMKDSLLIRHFYTAIEERQQLRYDQWKHIRTILNDDKVVKELNPILENTEIINVEKKTNILYRKRCEFDSISKSKNPMGIIALEPMRCYHCPKLLIDYVENNSIEFYGGLIHQYFEYRGRMDEFKESEGIKQIPPCSDMITVHDGSFYELKIADSIEKKDLYCGFFNHRDYIIHYYRCFKKDRDYVFESFHECSPDKLSLIGYPYAIGYPQERIQEINIYDPYYWLLYPYDLSKEYFKIGIGYEFDYLSTINVILELNFYYGIINLLSSSISPTIVDSDQMVFSFDYDDFADIEALTAYFDYPELQGIQNARVTLLTVLISILFTLMVAEFVRIIQITRNRSKMNKLMAKDGFVCYGSASDCINCSGYDKCKGSKYRFSVKTQDRYCGINYRKRKKKHQ